jgi:hypothetical protein
MRRFACALAILVALSACSLVDQPYYKFVLGATPRTVAPGEVSQVGAYLDWRDDLNRPAVADEVTLGISGGTFYTYDGPATAELTKDWLETNATEVGQQVSVTAFEPVYWLAPDTTGDYQLVGWPSNRDASGTPEDNLTIRVR